MMMEKHGERTCSRAKTFLAISLGSFAGGGLPNSEAPSLDCPDGVSVSVGQSPAASSLGLYSSLIRFGT